jgi:hypothetical protein
MRSYLVVLAVGLVTVASSAAVAGSAHATVGSSQPGGTWGPAELLNTSTAYPGITSISCAAAGDCSAVGRVAVPSGDSFAVEGIAVTETDGRWGAVQAIPGLTQLNTGGYVQISSVSCGAVGDCSAGGWYDHSSTSTAFVVSQSGGTWGTAEPVTGVTSLGSTTGSDITGLSCPSAGDCTAVGDYTGTGTQSGFVVSETGGTWGQAQAVPGLASLNSGGTVASVTVVSCGAAGNCSMGGSYDGGGWVASEDDGTWSAATNLSGMGAPASMSCPAAGYCAAAGSAGGQALVADEAAGVWGDAEEVPGTSALAGTGFAQTMSVSCSSAGNCAAAGEIRGPGNSSSSVFVVSEVSGSWGTARLVAGLSNPGGENSYVDSLSCGAAGYCTAGGYYDAPDAYAGFVVNESAGTWAAAQTVPGLATAEDDASAVEAVSCAAAGYCSAGGWQDTDSAANAYGFVANEATASATGLTVSAPQLTYGDENAEQIAVTVSSPDGGTPTGTVAVTAGSGTLCTITLTGATGTCTLPSTSLPGGSYDLTASYSGDSSYLASQSPASAINVARVPSKTSLTLSSRRVTYRQERRERLTVIVKLAFGAMPAGTVAITAGRTTLCVIALRAGGGSCVLRNRQLKTGTYRVRAAYGGNADASPSDSARMTLRVVK